MKKLIIILATVWILMDCLGESIWAWDNEITHKDLTEQAVYKSSLDPSNDNILKYFWFDNGFNEKLNWPNQVCDEKTHQTDCSIKDWLKYGAEKEDAMFLPLARMYRHFHDPYKDSGLDDILTGESALWWAQDTVGQSNDPLQGDQSWATLRQLYYDALTAGNETDRRAKFAQLFKGLGHQMHLLQDMAVPSMCGTTAMR